MYVLMCLTEQNENCDNTFLNFSLYHILQYAIEDNFVYY